jgi:hypothetical protein
VFTENESRIDLLVDSGVGGLMVSERGGDVRSAILAGLMAHLCATCFAQELHPQVIVAGGFDLFATTCRNTYKTERFTPFELRCMWECIKHYANNPQDARAPQDLWPELTKKAQVTLA